MKKFLATSAGSAVGILLYTAFMSSTHEPDWYRAAFVGCCIGLVTALVPGKKKTPDRASSQAKNVD